MEIYIYIDGYDLEDIADNIAEAISEWINPDSEKVAFVDTRQSTDDEEAVETDWKLGINLSITASKHLKTPLSFLYGLAKEHQCDFVVGVYDTDTGVREDVCYFGAEEGKPDFLEIANYLGL